jgi:hypothetical protein
VSRRHHRALVFALTVLATTSVLTAVSSIAVRAGAQDEVWETSRARDEARDILSERRFHGIETPRPFEGIFRRIASWLRSVGDLLRDVAGRFPGGIGWFVASVGVVLGAIIAWVVLRGARRRQTVRAGVSRRRRRAQQDDPDALDRRADEAAQRGDFESAVRLRFRAGLLRLDHVQAIDFRPSITTWEVARRLSSSIFDELASSFEAVAYGGRRANRADNERARTGWASLMSQLAAR